MHASTCVCRGRLDRKPHEYRLGNMGLEGGAITAGRSGK